MFEDSREWKTAVQRTRRALARAGLRLIVTRGAVPQMMIVDDRNRVVAGPVLPDPRYLRQWCAGAA
jgi:hypothetical protein